VKVRVVEVDALRKRISLTMKLDAPATTKRDSPRDNKFEQAPRSAQRPQQNQRSHTAQSTPVAGSAMAQAFAKLQPK
jgi:uncharacterized protein